MERDAPKFWEQNLGIRAAVRWATVACVMGVLFVVYTRHPYYLGASFISFRPLYTAAFTAWLVFGLGYTYLTLRAFNGPRFAMRDGALHFLILAKALKKRQFWRRVKSPRVRTTLLGTCIKAFYAPLMVGFFLGHASNLAEAWLRHKRLPALHAALPQGDALTQARAWLSQVGPRLHDLVPSFREDVIFGLFAPGTWSRSDVSFGLGVAYDAVFFVDCGWALIGYTLESRWLGNKTRSVEPTAFGWAAALACYPPFNNVLGTYLPLENGPATLTNDTALLVLRGITVILFFVYALATVSFGFKFSNLTNRGIVTRGPYRVVRHPAYACKCTAWWLEHLPTMTFAKAFFLSLLCGVYALRAFTEERHLSRDPAYRAYKQKVRWAVFPGLF